MPVSASTTEMLETVILGLHIVLNFANKQFVKYVKLTSGVITNTLSV